MWQRKDRCMMRTKWITILTTIILILTTSFMTGCGNAKSQGTDQNTPQAAGEESKDTEKGTVYPLTVTDSLGNEVTIEKEPARVISLSPANTEILFALDASERVKGRTDYCSYPEEAAEIASIGTYTAPNTELIISMEPDVIFASDYIDDNIRKQVEAAGAKVIVFSANTVEGVQDVILQAGEILDLKENAEKLVDSMDTGLKEIQDALAAKKETKSICIDIGSFYSAGPGSLLDDMLDKLDVENIAADTNEAYPQLSVETIIEKDPDIYLSLYPTVDELKETSGLSDLDCIKNDHIIFYEALSDEADMIQRPGPRVVEGMRLLAEQIYPGSSS